MADGNRRGAQHRRVLVAFAAVALGVTIWFLPRLGRCANVDAPACVVDPAYAEFATAPAWFDEELADGLRAELAELSPAPLRDDAAVEELASATTRASGWIASLTRVTKRYPDRLEVELELREPLALVEGEREPWLVDAKAVAIAPAFEVPNFVAAHALPTVHAARRVRMIARGVALDDRELIEGLAVAAELEPHHAALAERRLWPRVIDVTPAARGGAGLTWIELRLDRGPAIEWGRARATSPLGRLEPTPESKVRALLKVAENHPDLAGIQRLRLQFATPSLVLEDLSPPQRPLSQAGSPR